MAVVLPSHLQATDALVSRAYPNGVDSETYELLLRVFYNYLCDENLAILAVHWSGKDLGITMNDVLAAGEICATQDLSIPEPLLRAGFMDWTKTVDLPAL